ncbi:FtsX-like permease family protein [uncultured Bacteroides sp.]|uniref:ABC transporter permease n=1 Tax=uncultured Bacteroides sp. TaxID=162156 RepID=UPI0025FF1673|nr:FtsX-like permease family protein [uncultured Bacteroides sp.]
MRQLYYSILMLLRGRSNNLTKTISLTLGLFIGILLFACVAFQLSYNRFFDKPEQLYLAYMTDVKSSNEGINLYGPFAKAMREEFPEEVEDATVFRDDGMHTYYSGKKRLQEHTIWADWNLFSTLGIKVLAGKSEDLQAVDAVFISRSVADQISEGGELNTLIGKQLYLDRKRPFTIWGIFENLPENADFPFDVVRSMNELWNDNRAGWKHDISYSTIIRFRNPAKDVPIVEARLPEMMKKYMPDFNQNPDQRRICFFRPLTDYHTQNPTAHIMIVVMTVLAIAILLIAAFNYVLISVSSLTRRAKEVGVHKCSGAADGTVFGMFLTETAILVAISVLLTGTLMYVFRDLVEDVAAARLASLFTIQTLWVPVLVIIGVFLLAGILPAWLFSSIPVTQVFRRYSEGNTWWKRPLLFVQFAGVSFISGFLLVVLFQYRMVVERPLGYDPARVATMWSQAGGSYENRMSVFKSLPMVEDYSFGSHLICSGHSTENFNLDAEHKLSTRMRWVPGNFLPMMKIRIVEGRNFNPAHKNPDNWLAGSDELIVNETFVREAGWTGNVIGRVVDLYDLHFTIVGVMQDYLTTSAYESQKPEALLFKETGGVHYVRLKEPFGENLAALNRIMQETFPADDVVFTSLEQKLDEQYTDIRRFRDAVLLASVSIFIVALMGLTGYINDEVHRRSKEIAIRKVNGALAQDIIRMLTRDVAWIALPAVLGGCVCASVFGRHWLNRFEEQAQVDTGGFALIAIFLLLVIAISIGLRTRRIANENPVNSIKNE